MTRFSSKIRKLAATDKLISVHGVAGFVQAVLVPELTVMLVTEDMDVDDEDARKILRESTEIGDLLNKEEEDYVDRPVEVDDDVDL